MNLTVKEIEKHLLRVKKKLEGIKDEKMEMLNMKKPKKIKYTKCISCKKANLYLDFEIYFGMCQSCQDKMDLHIQGHDDD